MNPFENFLRQGNEFFNQQRWAEAVAACTEALKLQPANADAWQLLGAAHHNASQFAQAQHAFEHCLSLAPGRIDASIRLAFLLNMLGQPKRAIEILQATLVNSPQLSVVWIVLSHSYQLLGETAAAIEATRRAIACPQAQREAHYQLADLLVNNWALDECEAVLHVLLRQHPDYADAWALFGICLRSQGRHEESLGALRQSLSLANNPRHHSKYLAGLQYIPEVNPALLLSAHAQWAELHAQPANSAASASRTLPTKLRLGFVSADFARHPIGFLALGALESLDKSRFEIVCYSDRGSEDDFTQQFRAAADHWRVIKGHTDHQVADQIRADDIHILFDLTGHFSERFTLFALRPAPVQITWLGYVGTTGLPAIDYLLADRFHVPSGEDSQYAERILRMPNGYVCYRPPTVAPPVGPLPAQTAGHITFGCLNNPAKYSPPLFDAWSTLLCELPTARLLLKFGGLDQPALKSRLEGEFQRRGIDPRRVQLETISGHFAALDTYNRIDLALDTQPYSGGLTTCESLWMGVPVVTFPGQTFAGRHSTSHLMNSGLEQFVAADWAGYIALARHWSRNLEELAKIRSQMREQVANSPLCDAIGFAENLTDLLEKCWKNG